MNNPKLRKPKNWQNLKWKKEEFTTLNKMKIKKY